MVSLLSRGKDIVWEYRECGSGEAVRAALDEVRPDLTIFNSHPSTMPWLTRAHFEGKAGVAFGVLHGVSQKLADQVRGGVFDFMICLDPTIVPRNPQTIRVPRFLPAQPPAPVPLPEVFTVGSFGFATPGKGFDRLCALVNGQFDRAVIRLNLPRHDDPHVVSDDTLNRVVAACRAAVTKPGIDLRITHDFHDDDALVTFLAGNTLNAFLYEDAPDNGISSCVDFALASGRPFALTRSSMFRNLLHINPSIFIEDRGLAAIATGTTEMIDAERAHANPDIVCGEWIQAIQNAIRRRDDAAATPDGRGFNKILDDRSRKAYGEALDDLSRHAPEMIARKIERANIQQAFGLATAEHFLAGVPNPKILAAGSFEDTAVATLRAKGYRLDEIDPNVNGMMLQDFYTSAAAQLGTYDIALSISVLEHVADDATFVRMMAEFLKPGGIGILTVDFAEAWRPGQDKPIVDHRLYTTADLRDRLLPALGNCALVDVPTWAEGKEDFEYEGSRYGFAGFVFRKLDARSIALAAVKPVWCDLLAEANAARAPASKPKLADKMTTIRRIFRAG